MGFFDRFRAPLRPPPSSHGPDGPVAAAALAACDPLFALLPLPWRSAALRVARVKGSSLRLEGITAKATDGTAPPLLRELDDTVAWTAAANVGFTKLLRKLEEAGGSWDGGDVEIERRDDALVMRLFYPRGALAHEITIGTDLVQGTLVCKELLARLEEGVPRWAAREGARNHRLANLAEWSYLDESGMVRFRLESGETLEVPAQVLGSYSSEVGTWCWSWANSSFDPAEYEAVVDLLERVDRAPGLGALWRPGYCCTETFAAYVCELAAEDVGATAVFRHRDEDGLTVFFALMA